jgi:hypothetical protein
VPSRFGSPRGSIPRILRDAGEIADARMRSVQRYLDDFTAADDPQDQIGGGARLARRDFVALLRQSPDFQQQVANRWVFASQKERDALLGVLREAFPAETAPSTTNIPAGATPATQTGTGLGGPPQGASPVGPQASPGGAPPALGAPPPGPPRPPGGAPLPPPTTPAGPPLGAPPVAAPPPLPPGPGAPALAPPGLGPLPVPPQPLGLPVGPGGHLEPLLPPVPPIGPNAPAVGVPLSPPVSPVAPPGPPRASLAAGLV